MQYRKLGATGPMVSAIGLGAMSFGGIFGATDEGESLSCLDAMLETGIDFIDTANIYGMGISETVIGTWLASRKPQVTIATKASFVAGPDRRIDNSEAHLRAELEASLKRLGRDHVELFYIHRREQSRPLAEVVGTLSRLIEEGKIGGYGLSEVAPYTIRAAHALHPVTAVQNEYSLWTRAPELGVIQTCKALGIAFIPFSPLARGMLGDAPIARPEDGFRGTNPRFSEPNFSANLAKLTAFRAFAAERGWSTPAAALAWVLQQGDHLIPIPGTRYAQNLRQWVQAAEIRFTPEDWAEIDRLLPPGWAEGDRYGDHQLLAIERYC
ncbi:aldo/keto reductase [Fuscibacter oryzae]|uniref:Aldo/keto reductase n=1 Tax=Fuscibacter oryzae TaxID=2803939 RepID=A0A8J7MUS7_9RHOB|nr:aldo/keto reductase [Fuscibacter oryzae]MBL4929831.1 aldo/keto reductase [Fuscibacter oryzae]